MNKIEEYKKEKDGLDVLEDVPRYAQEGWEAISEGDRERLKWTGVFFRRQTPGYFMMRVRIPNGISNAAQIWAIGEISRDFGKGFCDITTRQQMQLRWFRIENVPAIWDRLKPLGWFHCRPVWTISATLSAVPWPDLPPMSFSTPHL